MIRRALNLRLACQAAAMKISANIIVQLIARWRVRAAGGNELTHPTHAVFDWEQVLEFGLYGSFNSQLGNVIQFLLEDWFPTKGQGAPAKADEWHVIPPGAAEDPEKRRQIDEKRDDEKRNHDSSAGAGSASSSLTLGGAKEGPHSPHSPESELSASSSWLSSLQRLWVNTRWRELLRVHPDVIWRNLLAKLILDQTIGLIMSACIFITVTNIARVPHPADVIPLIEERVPVLVAAGWHIWPLVALCNFLWVPVRSRVLVAVFVGFGWSIFLSVFAMRT